MDVRPGARDGVDRCRDRLSLGGPPGDARDPDHPWRRRQTISFLAGLALCWFVLLGPVGYYDDTFFWAHMVQHVALMMIIAPLLLLGSPVLLLLRASTPSFRRAWVLPVLRGRVLMTLTRPLVGWLLFAGVLVGTHFSPFYEFSLEHPLVHEYVEHPLYLAGADLLLPAAARESGAAAGALRRPRVSLFSMMFPETWRVLPLRVHLRDVPLLPHGTGRSAAARSSTSSSGVP